MDFLKEILEKLQPPALVENSLAEKLDLNLEQIVSDKHKLENFIDLKKKQLNRLEELLNLITKSEETVEKIKKLFKCEKCAANLKPIDKFKPGKNSEQLIKNKYENQVKNINNSQSSTFNRLQKIVNDCNKPKAESAAKKYQYSIENNGLRIHRSKPHPEMENFDLTKFKLVELHMGETALEDFSSSKEWTLIEKIKKNTSLEWKMARRHDEKISHLKQSVSSDIFFKLTKRNLINDMCMLMNYDFCNNRYGFKCKKPKKIRKTSEISKNLNDNDKNENLMLELYGFETDNKENETSVAGDDLYDDLTDNTVIDLDVFDFKKLNATTTLHKKDHFIDFKEEEKKLSPKKQFNNSELEKKIRHDAYSKRKTSDRHFSKSIYKSRSRSNSKNRKRSRSRSISRSNTKRRELNKSYDDRKTHHRYQPKHKYN